MNRTLADVLWFVAGLALLAGLLYGVLRVAPVAWQAIWGA